MHQLLVCYTCAVLLLLIINVHRYETAEVIDTTLKPTAKSKINFQQLQDCELVWAKPSILKLCLEGITDFKRIRREIKSKVKMAISKAIIKKRSTKHYFTGRMRGQTQSQYLNFGGSQQSGKAEAESTNGSSRAVVTGSSGMGQAQSQTSIENCDECSRQHQILQFGGYGDTVGIGSKPLPDHLPLQVPQVSSPDGKVPVQIQGRYKPNQQAPNTWYGPDQSRVQHIPTEEIQTDEHPSAESTGKPGKDRPSPGVPDSNLQSSTGPRLPSQQSSPGKQPTVVGYIPSQSSTGFTDQQHADTPTQYILSQGTLSGGITPSQQYITNGHTSTQKVLPSEYKPGLVSPPGQQGITQQVQSYPSQTIPSGSYPSSYPSSNAQYNDNVQTVEQPEGHTIPGLPNRATLSQNLPFGAGTQLSSLPQQSSSQQPSQSVYTPDQQPYKPGSEFIYMPPNNLQDIGHNPTLSVQKTDGYGGTFSGQVAGDYQSNLGQTGQFSGLFSGQYGRTPGATHIEQNKLNGHKISVGQPQQQYSNGQAVPLGSSLNPSPAQNGAAYPAIQHSGTQLQTPSGQSVYPLRGPGQAVQPVTAPFQSLSYTNGKYPTNSNSQFVSTPQEYLHSKRPEDSLSQEAQGKYPSRYPDVSGNSFQQQGQIQYPPHYPGASGTSLLQQGQGLYSPRYPDASGTSLQQGQGQYPSRYPDASITSLQQQGQVQHPSRYPEGSEASSQQQGHGGYPPRYPDVSGTPLQQGQDQYPPRYPDVSGTLLQQGQGEYPSRQPDGSETPLQQGQGQYPPRYSGVPGIPLQQGQYLIRYPAAPGAPLQQGQGQYPLRYPDASGTHLQQGQDQYPPRYSDATGTLLQQGQDQYPPRHPDGSGTPLQQGQDQYSPRYPDASGTHLQQGQSQYPSHHPDGSGTPLQQGQGQYPPGHSDASGTLLQQGQGQYPLRYPGASGTSLQQGQGQYLPSYNGGALETSSHQQIQGQYPPQQQGSKVNGVSVTDDVINRHESSSAASGTPIRYQYPTSDQETHTSDNVTSFDDANSQAQASIIQINNETQARASAQGQLDGGLAQSQVSGAYSGTGSFAASAGTNDGKRGAHTQITGGESGILSSAQGRGGIGESQAQVQLSEETGNTISSAQSSGLNHGTNTQVQANEKGGMADAHSNGPGHTSSQAQIGFTPYDENENDEQKTPFAGGGAASAQSGTNTGQTQTQVQGKFRFGIKYSGTAQANSGNIDNSTNTNQTQFLLASFKPLSLLSNKTASNNTRTNKTEKQDTNAKTTFTHSNKKMAPGYPEAAKSSEYDEYDADYDNSEESTQLGATKSIRQTLANQRQKIVLDPLEDLDATVHQAHGQLNNLQGTVLQPGQAIPGSPGYQIPKGFRGRMFSVANGEKTAAVGYNSQAQSVSIRPGTGKIIYGKPIYAAGSRTNSRNGNYRVGSGYTYQPTQYRLKSGSVLPNFVSVTKSETGSQNILTGKKSPSVFYSQSSTCGYFSNTCVFNGSSKICMPKSKTNHDGSPIIC